MKTTKELRDFFESTTGNYSATSLSKNEIENIAKENDNLIIHTFAEIISNREASIKYKNDTEKIHMVYDTNGYIEGLNIKIVAMRLY